MHEHRNYRWKVTEGSCQMLLFCVPSLTVYGEMCLRVLRINGEKEAGVVTSISVIGLNR